MRCATITYPNPSLGERRVWTTVATRVRPRPASSDLSVNSNLAVVLPLATYLKHINPDPRLIAWQPATGVSQCCFPPDCSTGVGEVLLEVLVHDDLCQGSTSRLCRSLSRP